MRARTSTIGLNAGCVVTSATRSPSIQTSRPSRMDSRYSPPLRITVASSSTDLRQDDRERVLDVFAGVCLRRRPVAPRDRREDPPVAVDRAPGLLEVVEARDAVVEVVLPAAPAELRQPRVRRGGDDPVVKALVELDLLVGPQRDGTVARRVELVEGPQLIRRRASGGKEGRISLQRGAHLVDRADLLRGVLMHDPAAAIAPYEPVEHEPLERLAHGRPAHAQAVRQLDLDEALVRSQHPVHDVGAHAVVDALRTDGADADDPRRGAVLCLLRRLTVLYGHDSMQDCIPSRIRGHERGYGRLAAERKETGCSRATTVSDRQVAHDRQQTAAFEAAQRS